MQNQFPLPVLQYPIEKTATRLKTVLYIIIAVGILLRLFHYLNNRSLWEDEVFLASSLIHMDFKELATQPLEYMQRAPLGFLWLERLVVVFWDHKEMSLRLVSFLGGIASVLLFVKVARFFLQSQSAFLAAVTLVAISPPLVYHSVEVKQYGTEFLATILALYLYVRYHQTNSLRHLLWWGIAGAAILWFSFSSLFVFFGIAAAMVFLDVSKRNWKVLILHLIPFGLWFVSFIIQYVFFISRFPQEEWLVQFWRNREAFMPFPPLTVSDFGWPLRQIYSLIRYPMGLSWFEFDYTIPYSQLLRVLARFPFIAFWIGALGFWRLLSKEKSTLLIWAMPILMALAASSLEFYPVKERMTVFLAPILLLVIAKGIEHFNTRWGTGVATTMVVLLLVAAPAMNSLRQLFNPDLFGDYKNSKQREVMQHLRQNYRAGDIVYIYWNNLPSYKFYEETYDMKFNAIYGSDMRSQSTDFKTYFQNLEPELKPLETHKRVWYLYKPYNGLKLGDIENEPTWYYRNVNAYKKMLSYMGRFGNATWSFPNQLSTTDVQLVLFEKRDQSSL